MLIKKIVTLLLTILTGCNLLYAQQQAVDAERLSGEWQITKVEMRLFTQKNNSLLEAKTFTTDSAINNISGQLPLNLHFDPIGYVIKFNGSIEMGTFTVQDSLIHLQKGSKQQLMDAHNPLLPGISYQYFMMSDTSMKLTIPAAFYKDNKRNIAVRLEYFCYYNKK